MSKKFSDWLRIDLHIHTDKSKETKENDYQGNFSVSTLYEKLKENYVEIFSLTDHNIINLDAYREYYRNYSASTDPLLLVGVELDIEVQDNGNSRLYHSLLIFDYCTIDKAEEISTKLNEKYSNKGLEDKERKLDLLEIVELFQNDDFFFIPHADGHRNIVSAYADIGIDEAQKMVLLMPSALEKVTNEERRKAYNKGFSQRLTESFQKDDIPYIEFSDNHNVEQYPKRHKGGIDQENHSFYYIKGSKNYETIRLAFIDPRSRIKSSKEYEEIDNIANKLEKIKIDNEQKIESTEIYFSPHLNVIIGGRSSGKSLLMNVLGSKIDRVAIEGHYNVEDENFLIKAKDDNHYKQRTTVGSNLIYINQGDIVRYFELNDLKSLAKDSHKLEDYNEAKDEIATKRDNLKGEVSSLVDAYGVLFDIDSHIKYELHQSTIHNIFSEEYMLCLDEEELKEKHIDSERIVESKSLVDEIFDKTEKIKSDTLHEFTEEENSTIEAFLSLLKAKKELLASKEKNDRKKINFIQRAKAIIDNKNSTLSHGAKEKARAKEKLDELKQEIGRKFQKAANLRKQSSKIESYDFATEKKIGVSNDVFLVLGVEQNRNLKDMIISDVINSGESLKSLYLNLLGLYNGNKSIKNLGGNTKDKLERKIGTVFNAVYVKFNTTKDYLYYSDGTTSKENSPGLNSEKYLKVILGNESIKVIFIDQPEDNLGNKFISHTLVDIIRNIKFRKQVFLVTHNPSIVVYGDAECIVLAENDEKITYKQITLENKDSQKEICSVLDGGEYIFDNRSKKYNIQRILRGDG